MSCPFCFAYHVGACKNDDRVNQMLVRMEANAKMERIEDAIKRTKEDYTPKRSNELPHRYRRQRTVEEWF